MAFIVLIAGGSSSGKSVLAEGVLRELGDSRSASLIKQDDYYKDLRGMTENEINEYNFDVPSAIDMVAFAEDVKRLANGMDIQKREYDFVEHRVSNTGEMIEAADVVICEGLFIFDLKVNADLKIFLDVEDEIRLKRRVERDERLRGIPAHETMRQYYKTVKPMHDKYVEPAKKRADVVLSGSEPLELLVAVVVEEYEKRVLLLEGRRMVER